MNVYAIGDLHLSGAVDKPMDVFGAAWENHAARIAQAWRETVRPEDAVLIPGDFSWAMYRTHVETDFEYLASLPGTKVLIRGNHDYWWNSPTQVRALLPSHTYIIQNDCVSIGALHICGTRGWMSPGGSGFTQQDEKLYQREAMRLSLSIARLPQGGMRIAMLHFPPINEAWEDTKFSEQLRNAGVQIAVYGHLHGRSCRGAFEGSREGVEYHLVSADHIGFAPKLILHT